MPKKENIRNFIFGSLPESNSAKGTLNSLDAKKVGRQLVVLLAGVILTTLISFVQAFLTGNDFGQYQFVVTMFVSSGALEIARRWVAEHFPTKK